MCSGVLAYLKALPLYEETNQYSEDKKYPSTKNKTYMKKVQSR